MHNARMNFMDFETYAEKLTITFLNRIKRFVFVMECQLVLCDVGKSSICSSDSGLG
jgi:hypothetical protein